MVEFLIVIVFACIGCTIGCAASALPAAFVCGMSDSRDLDSKNPFLVTARFMVACAAIVLFFSFVGGLIGAAIGLTIKGVVLLAQQ